MFSAWGAFVYRRRRIVALLSIVAALASLPFAAQASGVLSNGGWLVTGSESAVVSDRLSQDFGAGRSSLIILMRKAESFTGLAPITDAQFQDAVEASVATLRTDSHVDDVITYRTAGEDSRFISNDGMATYAIVLLQATDEESIDQVADLRAQIQRQPALSYALTGYGPLAGDANAQSEEDLRKAEIVSFPLAALILLLVFGSIVAAALPLVVAFLLTIPMTLALIFVVGSRTEMSIYVINVATMLGLALAIDYSLFLVSRFREELRRGRDVGDAVQIAVGTAGKAVTFSGIAVAIGLLGLLFFVSPAISSIGIAGSLVVLSSVIFGLTFLPAVLGMLGPRVNALSLGSMIRAIRRRLGLSTASEDAPRKSGWEGVARWVMSHPILVLIPTLLLLLAAGSPFLRLNQAVPDASVLPAGRESRDAYVALRDEFPGGATSPFEVLADVPGDPFVEQNVQQVLDYGDRITAVGQITSLESPFVLTDPQTGARLPAATVAQMYANIGSLPPQADGLEQLKARYVSGSTVRLVAHSTADPATQPGLNVTAELRAVPPGDVISSTKVGGYIPGNYDTLASMRERTPWAVAATMVVSALVLFLLFGSVVIPIKAVIMTLLSITASFGALVWIFQEGNLHEFLNFSPLGYTIAGNPVIMFAVIFGLSMDYEVLLLSRIQEAYRRTGDNTASVAEGLAKTAAVITGAALIMVGVFAAFALAETITIKSIGVGMAIAVLLDATVIRILLVPATMRLMGRWNWWAPGPLGRLADKLGFSHVEDEPVDEHAASPAPTSA